MRRKPRVLAIDAGGTMTDTFLIDTSGEFVVGKAQTTPEDESDAFMNSFHDALRYWDQMPVEEALPQIVSGVYSGTAMLNRLLTRKGRRIGLLVTAGQEDALRLERGVQTYLGYSYSDRLHVATHTHNEPLVPRERIRGVRGRIDLTGEEVFPLYEHEVEQSVRELIGQDVEGICICFMHFCCPTASTCSSVRSPADSGWSSATAGTNSGTIGKTGSFLRRSTCGTQRKRIRKCIRR